MRRHCSCLLLRLSLPTMHFLFELLQLLIITATGWRIAINHVLLSVALFKYLFATPCPLEMHACIYVIPSVF